MPRPLPRSILLITLALSAATPVGSEVFCKPGTNEDPRTVMPATRSLPWGAVGYLNNGCTATLISQSYILTAGHCLTTVANGAWQSNLYFFPNYNRPAGRVVATDFHLVDRAVVGARANVGERDWAIAHLATPVTSFPVMKMDDAPASTPFQVTSAGYGRDYNVTSPLAKPSGAPCGNGFCIDPTPKDPKATNVWWDNALVDPVCSVRSVANNTLLTDCAVVGGNSGSPIVRAAGGQFSVVGVIHGGSPALLNWDIKAPNRQGQKLSPVCQPRKDADVTANLNGGPAVQRFRVVPLRASGLAVTRFGAGQTRSVVFTTDLGASRIVKRERDGTSSAAPFALYRFHSFLPSPTQIAAFSQLDGRPALVAIAGNGRLFVQRQEDPGDWGNWLEIDRPAGVTTLSDIDTIDPIAGGAELYALASDGRAFRRRLESGGWTAWLSLPGSGSRRITAVQAANGRRLLVSVRANGAVYTQSQSGADWSSAFNNPLPFTASTFNRLVDVDAVRDDAGAVRIYGSDRAGAIFVRETVGKNTSEWLDWDLVPVRLFMTDEQWKKQASAPSLEHGFWQEVSGPRLDRVETVIAARRPEDGSVVLFAIDEFGNAYSSERRCLTSSQSTCHWTGWRPFTD